MLLQVLSKDTPNAVTQWVIGNWWHRHPSYRGNEFDNSYLQEISGKSGSVRCSTVLVQYPILLLLLETTWKGLFCEMASTYDQYDNDKSFWSCSQYNDDCLNSGTHAWCKSISLDKLKFVSDLFSILYIANSSLFISATKIEHCFMYCHTFCPTSTKKFKIKLSWLP